MFLSLLLGLLLCLQEPRILLRSHLEQTLEVSSSGEARDLLTVRHLAFEVVKFAFEEQVADSLNERVERGEKGTSMSRKRETRREGQN